MTMIKYINDIRYEYDEADGTIEVTKDGERLGIIYSNEGDWELIENGTNPIEEGWEDGLGNCLSYDGWGTEEL